MVKRVLLRALLWLAATSAVADIAPSVELTLLDTAARMDAYEWSAAATGSARITFRSEGNENVRAQLSVEALAGDEVAWDITRAFLKVRFPSLRITQGKAPLDWGEGFSFNAGDVVFGARPAEVDITAEELRDDAVWLSGLYVPLGPFAFAEVLALAPELNLSELLGDPSASPPRAGDTAAAARLLAKIASTQVEVGYMYAGAENEHRPEVSVQGNLYVDWYVSATTIVPGRSADAEALRHGTSVSWGLFHVLRLRRGGNSSLSLRLEGLLRPDGAWRPEAGESDYGLLLYPEIVWGLGASVELLSRNFLCPIDGSGLMSAGVNWNVYEGLEILAFLSIRAGEEGDLYSWNDSGAVALSAGMRFIY